MAKLTFILTGDDRLNAKLALLKGAQAKSVIRSAARTAMRPVHAAARRNAPRRSGVLAMSIKIKAMKRSRSRVGVRLTTSATDSLYQGKQFHGAFQEFGWKSGRRLRNADLGIAKRKRRTTTQRSVARDHDAGRRQIPGKHYMKAAAEGSRFAALEIYRHEIGQGLERLAGGA